MGFIYPGAGERNHGRRRRHRRGRSHVRAASGRHGAVLGAERRGAARGRDHHELVHPRGGGRNHGRRRRQRRCLSHLRAPLERDREVLGRGGFRQRLRPAGQRSHDRLLDSGHGDGDRGGVDEQRPHGGDHRCKRAGGGSRFGDRDDHGDRRLRGKREHDAHRQPGAGGAHDHGPAGEPDGHGGPDGDLLGDGDGDRAAQLSVAEGRGADQRGDVGELHDAAHDERRRQRAVHRGSQQYGGERDEQRRDADGEPGAGGAHDHEPAGEPDGDGGSDGDLLGDGDGDRAAQLPVAEGRGADQRGDAGELHHAAYDDGGQRGAVHGGGEQYGGQGGEQRRDADGQLSADDHEPARGPDGGGGAQRDREGGGGGKGGGAAKLPVAEGRGADQRGDAGELHHAAYDERGQRGAVHGGGEQYGGQCAEQRRDADGQLSADDHEPAGEPDGDGGPDGDLLGDGDGDRAAQLPVAEGRGADQRGDAGELYHAAHDDGG